MAEGMRLMMGPKGRLKPVSPESKKPKTKEPKTKMKNPPKLRLTPYGDAVQRQLTDAPEKAAPKSAYRKAKSIMSGAWSQALRKDKLTDKQRKYKSESAQQLVDLTSERTQELTDFPKEVLSKIHNSLGNRDRGIAAQVSQIFYNEANPIPHFPVDGLEASGRTYYVQDFDSLESLSKIEPKDILYIRGMIRKDKDLMISMVVHLFKLETSMVDPVPDYVEQASSNIEILLYGDFIERTGKYRSGSGLIKEIEGEGEFLPEVDLEEKKQNLEYNLNESWELVSDSERQIHLSKKQRDNQPLLLRISGQEERDYYMLQPKMTQKEKNDQEAYFRFKLIQKKDFHDKSFKYNGFEIEYNQLREYFDVDNVWKTCTPETTPTKRMESPLEGLSDEDIKLLCDQIKEDKELQLDFTCLLLSTLKSLDQKFLDYVKENPEKVSNFLSRLSLTLVDFSDYPDTPSINKIKRFLAQLATPMDNDTMWKEGGSTVGCSTSSILYDKYGDPFLFREFGCHVYKKEDKRVVSIDSEVSGAHFFWELNL